MSGVRSNRNIVILACFSNHWNTMMGTVNAASGRTTVSEYSNLFNQVSHSTDGAVGSVRDYYKEVSYANLTVDSVVTRWVRLPQNESYYGTDGGSVLDVNGAYLATHAVQAADAAGFDFSQGDGDGDGWVDCLTVIHSGHGQEITGNPATCVWSKQGELASLTTTDGVKMKRYHTEPAMRGLTNSSSIIRIGVICHEMGHFFGLPDLYDYSNATDGLGRWCVMAHGNWNGTDGKRPAHFSAYAKAMLGFVKPVHARSRGIVSLARVEDNPAVLLALDGMTNGESFLFENRARTGFDNDSAAIFPGLLIYHVDRKSANNSLSAWAHPLVKIEEGDGDNSLGTIESPTPIQSELGDVWCSSNGLSGGFRDQTGNQGANAMHYQSAAYNRANSLASYSYLRISNLSASASTMSFSLQTVRTAVSNQAVYASGYAVAWAPCSQAAQYAIQEGLRVTQTSFSDGAESEESMLDAWDLAGSVRRSSTWPRSGSWSYLLQYYDGYSWYSPVQAMTLRTPFKVTASTSLSFYLMSLLHADGGDLKCQISKDNGLNWRTLGTYNGYLASWTSCSYPYSSLSAQGIGTGDMCIVRFVMNAENTCGWSGFPGWGFALDDISLSGAEVGGHGGWTILATNVTGSSYFVNGATNGIHAYRVQALVNGIWRGYGDAGETTVVLPRVTLAQSGSPMPENGGSAMLTATLSQLAPLSVMVTLGFSGLATETNDFTALAVPPVITIPAYTPSGTLMLMAVNDSYDETNETIVADIVSVMNGEEHGVQQATVVILDDDPPPGSFEEWARNNGAGTNLLVAFTNDLNTNGIQNGFEYAFGANLRTNEPLLTIFVSTNQPIVDTPRQMTSTVSYVDILLEMNRLLSNPAGWTTNGLHRVYAASCPSNRVWHTPNTTGTNAFFRLRGFLK